LSDFLKFKLPVGAILEGMIHLGDGVFAGYALPAATPEEKNARRVGRVRTVIQGLTATAKEPFGDCDGAGQTPAGWDNWAESEFCDLPVLDASPAFERMVLLKWPGGVTEVKMAEDAGISYEELVRRLDAEL
jgi:hypothetical protein